MSMLFFSVSCSSGVNPNRSLYTDNTNSFLLILSFFVTRYSIKLQINVKNSLSVLYCETFIFSSLTLDIILDFTSCFFQSNKRLFFKGMICKSAIYNNILEN